VSILKNISKRLFDLFFVIEDETASAEVIRGDVREPPVQEEPQAAAKKEEAAARIPDKPEVPTETSEKMHDVEIGVKVAGEDPDILRAVFDAIFAPVISFGDMRPDKRASTVQDKKMEAAEYARFKKEVLEHSPKSASACVKALADMCHRELASLSRDGERVKRYGLSRAVICKSKGRYRARYERISSYDMRQSDDLEKLHIVDGEGRCYNNLGRAWTALKAISHKAELLKRVLCEDYSLDISNLELVNMLLKGRES